jgi:glycosyltransferase involved in cell wall biosynthesis
MLNANPTRIARIVSRLAVGGPARHVCCLSAQLDPLKYESWLICGRPEKGELDAFEIAAEAGVKPIYVDKLKRQPGFADFAASFQLNRLLGEIKPQIIETHTAKAGALGRSVALLRALTTKERPRLIHTFHGHVFHDYFNAPVTKTFIAIERQLANLTDMIVTVGPTTRRQLIEEYHITKADKVRVVPLGLDFAWLSDLPHRRGWLRNSIGATDSTVIFGFVGRLTAIKNPAMILRAFARMQKDTELDARLVMIGDGELADSLKALARELGIDSRTTFCGWVLDRAKIYCDLDLTCLTSQNEGTPVCLIESLAARTPVIATAVGGVGDVVQNGPDGALIPPGDEEAFAAAMSRVARTRMAIPARRSQRISSEYSISRLVTDTANLYEELLQGGGEFARHQTAIAD